MRREKRTYIRLAAFFAGIPPGTNRVTLSLKDVDEILGEALPPHARFPFWWSNDKSKVHARAWLSARWEVADMDRYERTVSFRRATPPNDISVHSD